MVRIIHPYRELHKRALRMLDAMTLDERTELIKSAGIWDKNGNLTAKYSETSPVPKKPRKAARTKAAKRPTSKSKKAARTPKIAERRSGRANSKTTRKLAPM